MTKSQGELFAASQIQDQGELFDLSKVPISPSRPKMDQLEAHIWTKYKAQLIARYLRLFCYVTKHGTYLDCFAGHQSNHSADSWAAKLVLETKPQRIRRFYFFELKPDKYRAVAELVDRYRRPGRSMRTWPGDVNELLERHFELYPIKSREAAFALLDQHTHQCDWETVRRIAQHKKSGHKIELFYFLASSWLDRTLAALSDPDETIKRWWGQDWSALRPLDGQHRAMHLAERFQREFGYNYAYAYPIYEREDGGRTMFHMVHASDHPEARKLMFRAYKNAMVSSDAWGEMEMDFAKQFLKSPKRTKVKSRR